MTTEQREAIDNLSEIVKLSKEELQKENENITAILDYKDLKSLDTVLSLIKQQQEEIAKYEKIYKEYDCYRWVKELNKKDKQIDLMAESIELQQYANIDTSNLDLVCEKLKCNKKCELVKKDCIKQYFADKVNSSEQN